mmetsp:Transcript_76672/g.221611  ORF Transcript_76672/g.221611 Transcript_76672/m.221611 type:complete len:212 (-) Transcript_76672:145-780(-)
MASSSEVFPWSTCPIIVTTGARGSKSAGSSLSVTNPTAKALSSMSNSSSSHSSSAPATIFPKPSTTAIQVAGSRFCVMVAMTPKSLMSILIMATGFSSIMSANSATVTGPSGSRTVLRSSAAANFASFSAVRSLFFRLPRRPEVSAARPFRPVPSLREVLRWFLISACSSRSSFRCLPGFALRFPSLLAAALPATTGATSPSKVLRGFFAT